MQDIEDFISILPRQEQLITRKLRSIILDADPRIREQFSYGVPYYFRNRRMCFIWPATAPHGPKGSVVSLGFCYGHMLSDGQGILKMEGRTQVSIVQYQSLREINETILMEVLQEAIMVDDLKFKKNKKQ